VTLPSTLHTFSCESVLVSTLWSFRWGMFPGTLACRSQCRTYATDALRLKTYRSANKTWCVCVSPVCVLHAFFVLHTFDDPSRPWLDCDVLNLAHQWWQHSHAVCW
jgi:hypothetical protein